MTGGSPSSKPFTIGFLGSMAIVSCFMILLYATTFPEASNVLLTALIMLMAGLFMAFLLVGIKFDLNFNFKQFTQTFLWTAMSFGAILIVNRYAPFRIDLEISPLSQRLLGVLMGVVEECFFRVFLCGMIYRFFNSTFLAIGASSLIWSIYHINRYGGSFNILMLIFLCGCILGASFIYSRNADNPMIAHGCVNYVAI